MKFRQFVNFLTCHNYILHLKSPSMHCNMYACSTGCIALNWLKPFNTQLHIRTQYNTYFGGKRGNWDRVQVLLGSPGLIIKLGVTTNGQIVSLTNSYSICNFTAHRTLLWLQTIRSVATHNATYNDTLKIITINTVHIINSGAQIPVTINNITYILLKHLTEIITINTAHITNSVAFTSIALHNVTYCYSTSLTPSQLIQHTSPTRLHLL